MSKGLLILGAGGHGKVVADAAELSGRWQHIAFLDDAQQPGTQHLDYPVLGDTARASSLREDYPEAVVALGNSAKRLRLIAHLVELGFAIATVQHPSAVVSRHATIGAGSVLFAASVVNAGSTLGVGCIVNTGATVDHDCRLGDGVHVSPGAHLAGGVAVGEASWVGIGACVRECVTVGRKVTVAAGAAVIADVGDGLTVGGVPAVPLSPRHD